MGGVPQKTKIRAQEMAQQVEAFPHKTQVQPQKPCEKPDKRWYAAVIPASSMAIWEVETESSGTPMHTTAGQTRDPASKTRREQRANSGKGVL